MDSYRHCPLCGARRGEGKAFCADCGYAFTAEAHPNPSNATAVDRDDQGGAGNTILFAAILAAVVVGALAAAYVVIEPFRDAVSGVMGRGAAEASTLPTASLTEEQQSPANEPAAGGWGEFSARIDRALREFQLDANLLSSLLEDGLWGTSTFEQTADNLDAWERRELEWAQGHEPGACYEAAHAAWIAYLEELRQAEAAVGSREAVLLLGDFTSIMSATQCP